MNINIKDRKASHEAYLALKYAGKYLTEKVQLELVEKLKYAKHARGALESGCDLTEKVQLELVKKLHKLELFEKYC